MVCIAAQWTGEPEIGRQAHRTARVNLLSLHPPPTRHHRPGPDTLVPTLALLYHFLHAESSEGSEIATGNPIMDLLVAVQRGVLLAAGKMGEVRGQHQRWPSALFRFSCPARVS